jgi:N-acetylmuramoyl-L-alanine amidase
VHRFIKIILFLYPLQGAAQPQIDVVFPQPDQALKQSEFHFIYGNVQPANAKFWINDKSVSLYKNGAFMAFMPVTSGRFVFHCKAVANGDTTSYSLPVSIFKQIQLPADSLAIDFASIQPNEDLILIPGDELVVSLRATPGCNAQFRIEGMNDWYPLISENDQSNFYSGSLFVAAEQEDPLAINGDDIGASQITGSDAIVNSKIEIQLQNSERDLLSHVFGNITFLPAPINRVVELLPEITILRTEPESKRNPYLPRGIKLLITGKRGDLWRVALDEKESGWLEDGAFAWLPEGTNIPQSGLGSIQIEKTTGYTRMVFPLQMKLPFHVEEERGSSELCLTIWGAQPYSGSMIDTGNDEIIKDISWSNSETGSMRFVIKLNLRQNWGYDAQYEGTSLQLDIRHPPALISNSSPLKGRLILLDPGHHPDEGAIGPTRLEERDINWRIAQKLKKMLEQKGATVVLTRSEQNGASIQGRIQMIEMVKPDAAISIHNNSLPEGFNPYRGRGTSAFYYHTHSYRLTRALHRNLTKDLRLPSQGVRFADLAICRPTNTLVALVEPAFMVIPSQEYLLGTDRFQTTIAKSLRRGLEQFFRESR